jgi:hypothetical protein
MLLQDKKITTVRWAILEHVNRNKFRIKRRPGEQDRTSDRMTGQGALKGGQDRIKGLEDRKRHETCRKGKMLNLHDKNGICSFEERILEPYIDFSPRQF